MSIFLNGRSLSCKDHSLTLTKVYQMHLVCLLCSAAVIFYLISKYFHQPQRQPHPISSHSTPSFRQPTLCVGGFARSRYFVYMESHTVWPPVPALSHWASCFQGSSAAAAAKSFQLCQTHVSALQQTSLFLLFSSWLSNSPWCRWTTLCLSIHPLMDIWVISTFCFPWLVLQWILVYKNLNFWF